MFDLYPKKKPFETRNCPHFIPVKSGKSPTEIWEVSGVSHCQDAIRLLGLAEVAEVAGGGA